jgi:DNA-binding PadR family transcriptional regulator
MRDNMAKDNKTIYAILGLLNHMDMTGYDIKKRVDETLGFFWNVGFGQIYPTLRVMEEKELITKIEETGEGRNRIIYRVTQKGTEELRNYLRTPAEKESVKYEILLKLFFGSMLKPEENMNLIKDFKDRSVKDLNILTMYKEQLSRLLDTEEDHIYYYLTVIFGEKIYKAYQEWAEEAEALLSKMKTSQLGEEMAGDLK